MNPIQLCKDFSSIGVLHLAETGVNFPNYENSKYIAAEKSPAENANWDLLCAEQ